MVKMAFSVTVDVDDEDYPAHAAAARYVRRFADFLDHGAPVAPSVGGDDTPPTAAELQAETQRLKDSVEVTAPPKRTRTKKTEEPAPSATAAAGEAFPPEAVVSPVPTPSATAAAGAPDLYSALVAKAAPIELPVQQEAVEPMPSVKDMIVALKARARSGPAGTAWVNAHVVPATADYDSLEDIPAAVLAGLLAIPVTPVAA